ncbi:pentapeptide repeat-containing protein [Streptomyces sp. ACA25]|uniref:pentapeptide repeat-containing protein n=1 Tax=Streptomyces sp. ACA25 TaxID=3022596 RepID=UPI00230793B1|nr:pentapeptide repeat-containing protein [Streptomyces sp. ACA25]MDB1089447.1 pentapeptide repeat-containing protein [Streptomyces sp. ACA25]
MTSANPDSPAGQPPTWPHCGRGATTDDPVGCRGIHVTGHTACLAHLDDTNRTAYLNSLEPGADIDHRGTTFTTDLLMALLDAVRDPTTSRPRLGTAWFHEAAFNGTAEFRRASFIHNANFDGATFTHDADFGRATFNRTAQFRRASFTHNANFRWAAFTRDADFSAATFTRNADFSEVSFTGNAWFYGVAFNRSAWFRRATFNGPAEFRSLTFTGKADFGLASFTGYARFSGATFTQDADFGGATFTRNAEFDWVTFAHDARFNMVRFEEVQRLGPMRCQGEVVLDGAVFGLPVTVEVSARSVSLRRTRWESTATLRLRHATVDLPGAVLAHPLTLAAEPAPFSLDDWLEEVLEDGEVLDYDTIRGRDEDVRVAGIGGVDAAHLTLTDVDLSGCRFAGAIHLDQLRLEGRISFAPPPTGWHRRRVWPARWSPRRTLAEEHHWRAAVTGQPARLVTDTSEATASGSIDGRRWRTGEHHPDLKRTPGPETVAALYRQLRKALEDGKNEPGAADFYYGECEMRRHDHTSTPRVERALLTVYWAVSGYGLRASRALAWLGAAMTATVAVMMLWGIPAEEPRPTVTGRQVEAGQDLALTTDTPAPVNPAGPLTERVNTDRFEKSLRVVINSVVFRSSGQDLTTAGTYTEMTTRITEPALLALAVLAVRARIKR